MDLINLGMENASKLYASNIARMKGLTLSGMERKAGISRDKMKEYANLLFRDRMRGR